MGESLGESATRADLALAGPAALKIDRRPPRGGTGADGRRGHTGWPDAPGLR